MMANSALESLVQSDAFSPKLISSSFFNIPGFFVGFGSKGSDSESIRSPKSPLDFSFFSNLSSQFSLKSPKSPTRNGIWDSSKVGLKIINLLADEAKSTTGVILSSPKRKNIIFGSEVKSRYFAKSKSFETESFQNSSPMSSSPKSSFSSKKFCSENRTSTVSSSSLFLEIESSSVPVPIGSLSAREIELSEDYTCIISYGPNPKTTHIFGDCVLNGMSEFSKAENLSSQEADGGFCYSCKKKLDEGDDDTSMYRGEKEFCSFDCGLDETGETCNEYQEDVFITGIGIDM